MGDAGGTCSIKIVEYVIRGVEELKVKYIECTIIIYIAVADIQLDNGYRRLTSTVLYCTIQGKGVAHG